MSDFTHSINQFKPALIRIISAALLHLTSGDFIQVSVIIINTNNCMLQTHVVGRYDDVSRISMKATSMECYLFVTALLFKFLLM